MLPAAILIVLTIGQTFVIATGGIDLSVASTMTLARDGLRDVFDTGSAGRRWPPSRPGCWSG